MRNKIIAVSIGAILAVGLAGCGKATEQYKDAAIEGERDLTPAVVGTMPDGFSNYAAKCEGPNRVYVLFHGDSPYGSIAVVPNDPRCTN